MNDLLVWIIDFILDRVDFKAVHVTSFIAHDANGLQNRTLRFSELVQTAVHRMAYLMASLAHDFESLFLTVGSLVPAFIAFEAKLSWTRGVKIMICGATKFAFSPRLRIDAIPTQMPDFVAVEAAYSFVFLMEVPGRQRIYLIEILMLV